MCIFKDQDEESKRLTFSLYSAGVTTEQVREMFEELYGRHYNKSSVSRMFDYAREEVQGWLNRDYKRITRIRGALPSPDATLLLLGRVAMSGKVYLRKVPKLNYEKEKFNWEE